jgi:hypothetical protein
MVWKHLSLDIRSKPERQYVYLCAREIRLLVCKTAVPAANTDAAAKIAPHHNGVERRIVHCQI